MNQTTLLLVGHGSRESSGNQEIEDFAQAWRAQRPQPRRAPSACWCCR